MYVAAFLFLSACGGSDDPGPTGANSGGAAGTGSGGSSSGGAAGSATGGSSSGGTAGSATGGSAGANTGGTAGTASGGAAGSGTGGGGGSGNCAGFPDASSTGIAGVGLKESDLKASPVANGTWTIKQPGVYSDFIHLGRIVVSADDVTLKRCVVRAAANTPLITNSGKNLVVEDCAIEGTGKTLGSDICAAAMGYSNYVARRVDASGCADGFKLGSDVTIEDSFIHSLLKAEGTGGPGSGTHNDGFQLNNNANATGTILISGNRTDLVHCTSNRQFQLGGNMQNLIIEKNCFSGLHGILNVGGSISGKAELKNNVLAGSPSSGPFTEKPGLYTGAVGPIVRSGNVFESGEPVDTDTRDASYACVP